MQGRRNNTSDMPDLSIVNEQEQKASKRNAILIMKRNTNKTRFVQIIQENLRYLVESKTKILTGANLALILKLTPYIELGSNMLASTNREGPMPISVLARNLCSDRATLSKNINNLLDVGILYEFVDVNMYRKYNRSVEERPLFMNPEIIASGDKNKIELTLTRLHLLNDRLEKKGILLPRKIWINSSGTGGMLYTRNTYLKKKKESNPII
jgi:hypothetical protein